MELVPDALRDPWVDGRLGEESPGSPGPPGAPGYAEERVELAMNQDWLADQIAPKNWKTDSARQAPASVPSN